MFCQLHTRKLQTFALLNALIVIVFGNANAYATQLEQQEQQQIAATTATTDSTAQSTLTATTHAWQTKAEVSQEFQQMQSTIATTTTAANAHTKTRTQQQLHGVLPSKFDGGATTKANSVTADTQKSTTSTADVRHAAEIAGINMPSTSAAAPATTSTMPATDAPTYNKAAVSHDVGAALQIELQAATEIVQATATNHGMQLTEMPNADGDAYLQLQQQQQQQQTAKHYEVPETMAQQNANADERTASKLRIIDVYATQRAPQTEDDADYITTTTTTASDLTTVSADDGLQHMISASNDQLLTDHTVFHQPRDVAEHRQNLVANEVEAQPPTNARQQSTPIKNVNHMAIQQISDFTGKLLADQDDIITEIEQKFIQLNVPSVAATTTAAVPTTTADMDASTSAPTIDSDSISNTVTANSVPSTTTTTQKPRRKVPVIAGHEFIERRVKKSFGFPLHHASASVTDMMSMPHIDFANTKFTDANSNTHAQLPIAGQLGHKPALARANGWHGVHMPPAAVLPIGLNTRHPEFSTTKFYNSKELYNELLLKKLHAGNTKFAATKNGTTDEITAGQAQSVPTNKPTNAAGSILTLNKLQQLAQMPAQAVTTTTTTTTKATLTTTPSSKNSRRTTNAAAVADEMQPVKRVTVAATMATTTTKTMGEPTTEAPAQQTSALPHASATLRLKSFTMSGYKNKNANASKNKEGVKATIASAVTGTTTAAEHQHTMPVATPTASAAHDDEVTFFTYPTAGLAHTVYAAEVHTPQGHSTALPAKSVQKANAQKPIARPRVLTRLEEKINALECELLNVPPDSHLWRGNETHELLLPITSSLKCNPNEHCPPEVVSWEGEAEIQSGDILIVEINDALLDLYDKHNISIAHSTQVYQVTRPGHEHCDVTEGILLDITPLVVDGRKLVTLYDKDLTEGVNLLIVVSELWGKQCVRLKVTTKTDNCGENADCSGKGVCFSNQAMEEYECQCCSGFAGPHCEEIDACTPSPCTNNGICVDLSQGHEGNAYQCLCPYGYAGKNCQYESDPCNAADCLNGGTCVGNSTHFRCDCAAGYTGPLCQHSLNECESSPCVHGICVDQEDGFRCFCQPGFAGELCNFEYNECESNPCQNAGECIDHIGSYECRCTKGYTGNRCQIKVDFCANKPCPEGQHCVDHGNDFSCECPEALNGIECGNMPRMQCNVNPCTHGGTCWSSGDSFYCACRPGFTGTMCEDEFVVETVVSSSEFMVDDTSARNFNDKTFGSSVVLKSPIELHNAYFAAGVLAAALFIVAIVVTICHCKVNQTYRKFSTRSTTFFPIIGFGRRTKAQHKLNKHWLSGKGFGNSTNNTHPNTGATLRANTTTEPPTQHQRSGSNVSGQLHERPFQRHLAMNLENDMYYTVDFCENSQHSPLIQ